MTESLAPIQTDREPERPTLAAVISVGLQAEQQRAPLAHMRPDFSERAAAPKYERIELRKYNGPASTWEEQGEPMVGYAVPD